LVFILFLTIAFARAGIGILPESSPAGRLGGLNAGDTAGGMSALPGSRRGVIFPKKVVDHIE
jgi:hypothetical protein